MPDTYAIEMSCVFSLAQAAVVSVEMNACSPASQSTLIQPSAWTDGTDWSELGHLVGWSDFPGGDIIEITSVEEG